MEEDKGSKLRRSCVESFVGLTADLKSQLYKCVLLVNDAYNKIYDPDDLNKVVHNVCVRIMEECGGQGALAGFFIDINLFNLFCFFRAFRMRTRSAATFNVPCAEGAQGILRILIERLLFCTEKMFLASSCSGVALPPRLCLLFNDMYTEMKYKCLGAWRRLACNRRPIMMLANSLLTTYMSYDSAGIIKDQMKALFLLVFQPIYLPRILMPLDLMSKGQTTPENFYSITGSSEKRRPITTGRVSSSLGSPGSSIMPEALILPIMEPGLLPASLVDLSEILSNPGLILGAQPLSQFLVSKPHPSLPQTVSIVAFNPGGCDPALINNWQAASQNLGEQPSAAGSIAPNESTQPQSIPDNSPVPSTSASNVQTKTLAACLVPAMAPDGSQMSFLASYQPHSPNTTNVTENFQPTQCLTLLQVTCTAPADPLPDTKVRAPLAHVPAVIPQSTRSFLRSLTPQENIVTGSGIGDTIDNPNEDDTEQLTPKYKYKSCDSGAKRMRRFSPVPDMGSPTGLEVSGTSSADRKVQISPAPLDISSSPDAGDQSLYNFLAENGVENWDMASQSSLADEDLLSAILQGLYQLDEPPSLGSTSPRVVCSPSSTVSDSQTLQRADTPSGERLTTLQPVSSTTPSADGSENVALSQLLQWRNYFLD
ncbi:Rta [Colobine gammaherpesvirus 1]|uniref:Rta n=1 Tax=Colobine gammaherpesvirus 1 TaxID=2597325 RepID=A0A5B8FKD8_9GAMA|nr:Rta [Colobine gammaherpesvirus 1]QDQ69256.1 Rta [Colobine gammaherpesvirus 1]